MGLFDAFSADDETAQFEAGFNKQKKFTEEGVQYGEDWTNQGVGALESGKAEGLNYLEPAYYTARGDIGGAVTSGQDYLTQGVNTASGIYGQALTPWEELSGYGNQGVEAHWNLTQDPDSIYDSELYLSNQQQSIDAINREANSRGMLASGNNTQDIIDYTMGSGLDYYNTLSNSYTPYFGLSQSAAQGQSDIYAQEAAMYDDLGSNQAELAMWGGGQNANLASQYGTNQANIATGTGTQIAGLYQNQGNLGAQAYTDLGDAGANMHTNTANAQSAADANMWNAILGGASLGAGIYAA